MTAKETREETTNLFVYGTLLDENLVVQLTGHHFETRDSVLGDCHLWQNNETGYFEICEKIGSRVSGKVLVDVDEASLKKLDAYESRLYERVPTQVRISGTDKPLDVEVYVPKVSISWWLRWLLSLVGGEVKGEFGNPKSFRAKCRSSLTSVGLAFTLNIGILVALLISQIGFSGRGSATSWHWPDLLASLFLVGFSFFLSGVTGGFTRRLGWTLAALPLPILSVSPGVTLGISGPFVLLLGAMGVLFVSALMLVVSIEFYDSGLNPYLSGRSVRNLEYNGSRFYFCGLWLTVLGLILFIASQAWQVSFFAIFAWSGTMFVVVQFEKEMGV